MEEERQGKAPINGQILIRAATRGEYSPSQVIFPLSEEIRNLHEMLSRIYLGVREEKEERGGGVAYTRKHYFLV